MRDGVQTQASSCGETTSGANGAWTPRQARRWLYPSWGIGETCIHQCYLVLLPGGWRHAFLPLTGFSNREEWLGRLQEAFSRAPIPEDIRESAEEHVLRCLREEGVRTALSKPSEEAECWLPMVTAVFFFVLPGLFISVFFLLCCWVCLMRDFLLLCAVACDQEMRIVYL